MSGERRRLALRGLGVGVLEDYHLLINARPGRHDPHWTDVVIIDVSKLDSAHLPPVSRRPCTHEDPCAMSGHMRTTLHISWRPC